MYPRIINQSLLLEPNAGGEGGGTPVTQAPVTAPIVTPSPASSIQIQALKGNSSPVRAEKTIDIPPSIKSSTFSLDDEDTSALEKAKNKINEDAHLEQTSPEFHDKIKAQKEADALKDKAEKDKAAELKKDDLKVKDDKKVEIKPLEAKLEKKDDKPKVEDKGKEKEERDLSIFPEAERDGLRKCSNEAFNFIKREYSKIKEIETEKKKLEEEKEAIAKQGYPHSWVEHPEAWRLSPVANKLFSDAQKIEFEENHWKAQIKRINEGEEWTALRGYTKEGKPVFSDPQPPTEEAKDSILIDLGKFGPLKQGVYGQINALASSFKQQHEQEYTALNKLIDDFWPWRKDEKDARQEIVKGLVEALPENVRSNPLAIPLGLMYASYRNAIELLEQATAEKEKSEKEKENKRLIEPAASSPTIGANNGGGVKAPNGARYTPPATFSLEGMQ